MLVHEAYLHLQGNEWRALAATIDPGPVPCTKLPIGPTGCAAASPSGNQPRRTEAERAQCQDAGRASERADVGNLLKRPAHAEGSATPAG